MNQIEKLPFFFIKLSLSSMNRLLFIFSYLLVILNMIFVSELKLIDKQ